MNTIFGKLTRGIFVVGLSGIASISHSETLLEIYQAALQNDHTYRAAEAEYAAGKESVKLGRAGLLPRLNGEASWEQGAQETTGTGANVTPGESNSNSSTYSVSLTQAIFDMSAWYTYKQGKFSTSASEAQFRSAQQNLIIRTAEAYFDVLKAVDNYDTAKAEENALKHQLEQTRQRFEVGLTAITEVHEAQSAFDSSTATRLITEGQLGIAFEALEVLTGQSYQKVKPLKKSFSVAYPEPRERHEWVKFAMENNALLKRFAYAAKASRQNAKAQKSRHFPTLSGSASYSDSSREGDILHDDPRGDFDTAEKGHSFGLTLSVPIYNGGSVSASRRQAHQQYMQAHEEYLQTQRDTIQNARSTHLTVVTSVSTVKARQQAITSSTSALEATQAGYEVGTRDLVDVLNAQRNLYRSQRDYFDALYDYVLSTLRLKEVAGSLSVKDVEELNAWLDKSRSVARQ